MENLPKILINLDISEVWGRNLTRSVVKYAAIHGPWTFDRQPNYYLPVHMTKKPPKLIGRIRQYQPDGIIMSVPNRQEEKELAILGIPIIVTGHKEGRYSSFANVIISDDFAIGRMAAKHLLERGFNFFAFCGYNIFWSHGRCTGFVQTIEEAGYKVQIYKQPSLAKNRSWELEQFILTDWLKSLAKPVGLMACADHRSLAIVEACKIAGLRIPIDIAIIGVDNDDLYCNLSPQPLSSVALSSEQTGYAAAELMDKMLKGEVKMTGQVIKAHPTHIAQRQSTDTLAIEDKEVARAIHYIRNNPRKLLRVDDVAEASMMSKRTLQKKIRKAIGHSVYDEIKNVQTEYIAQLLRDTNMSITQIALTIGYPGPEHISRLMQKINGISASEYRKKFGRH